MTAKKFFAYCLTQYLFFAGAKVLFFGSYNYAAGKTGSIIYLVVVAVISAALIRRLGVINFLEAAFAAGLWTVINLLLDILITRHMAGNSLLSQAFYWYGFLAMIFSVIVFHKKRHVEIRKSHAGQHH